MTLNDLNRTTPDKAEQEAGSLTDAQANAFEDGIHRALTAAYARVHAAL